MRTFTMEYGKGFIELNITDIENNPLYEFIAAEEAYGFVTYIYVNRATDQKVYAIK